MRVRVFSFGPFPALKGEIDLPALPRAGEDLLSGDARLPDYYRVVRVLHVVGADPVLFVEMAGGEGFGALDPREAGLLAEPVQSLSYYAGLQAPLGL